MAIKIDVRWNGEDAMYMVRRVEVGNSILPVTGDILTQSEVDFWDEKLDVTLVLTREGDRP